MAITSEVLVGTGLTTPAGYTDPVAALTLTDPSQEPLTITVVASTVDDADPEVGLNALLAAIKTQADIDIVALGVDATATIEAQYTVRAVSRDHGASIYSDTDNFICSVRADWVKL